ncbi:DUF1801 domain-containing protein [Pseudoxanthomonas indica]|uniref:YdhG-like domain-containing protein n=1 Tax=Pseudoxanthomonas indica TaxID=428993 RepID=A0A1T5K601_9GAMM|nr:DUF1801 domain-containing protein [Pseudoxanthomonas indica]GGD46977.1 hypothetical protein GCM10007235_18580 [Pseudoxanthomonas indica]SKC59051.1 protein of unknown function (DU1801) [Pseudoxanthomonas indica]
MVQSKATTVEQYLAELPADRREVIASVRALVNQHLPAGYQEAIRWGMISWEVPLARLPDTYNGQPLAFAALAAQKNYYALYLSCVDADSQTEQLLRNAYAEAGRKLDFGKSCLRFKQRADLLDAVVGQVIAATPVDAHIAHYQASRVRH